MGDMAFGHLRFHVIGQDSVLVVVGDRGPRQESSAGPLIAELEAVFEEAKYVGLLLLQCHGGKP
jgi:hypothetical protein